MTEDFLPGEDTIIAPCGATAEFDYTSGIGFRCLECGAVIGNVGMPQRCKDIMEKEKMWKLLND